MQSPVRPEPEKDRMQQRLYELKTHQTPFAITPISLGASAFRLLVGQVESSVTFRATVRVRIKARFAGNGPSLGKKRNTESHSHSGSRRAAPQASWAVLQPLERACHSLRTAPCPQCLWRG